MQVERDALPVRRIPLVALAIAGVVLFGLATAQVVAFRSGAFEPARACEASAPLRIVFGDATTTYGRTSLPLFAENAGDATQRVLVAGWSADSYRVRWDGRLASLGTQEMHAERGEGDAGEDLAPGARLPLGHVQLSDVDGKALVVAFAGEACGSATFRA